MNFGNWLRQRRKTRALTQQQFADYIEDETGASVSVQTIVNWEKGKTTPQARYIHSLAEALNSDIETITKLIRRR